MPIYAYRCDACGFRKDVLQKMSDSALSVCPSCGVASFAKQLSAPAFQLKGTGWYATDFRDKARKPEGPDAVPAGEGAAAEAGAENGSGGSANGSAEDERPAAADGKKTNGKADGAPASGAAAPAVATAPVPKPGTKGNGSTSSTGTTGGGSGAG